MRQLTLLGFLSDYVKLLSENNTLNIHKLYQEVLDGNMRVREPFFLYCYYSGKSDVLTKYLDDANKVEYNTVSNFLDNDNKDKLPADYDKVFKSYQCRAGMKANEDNIKSLMFDKIVKLQKQKNISNYRIYKDLGINGGNFNDFIKNRHLNRLSLSKSREVYEYLRNV